MARKAEAKGKGKTERLRVQLQKHIMKTTRGMILRSRNSVPLFITHGLSQRLCWTSSSSASQLGYCSNNSTIQMNHGYFARCSLESVYNLKNCRVQSTVSSSSLHINQLHHVPFCLAFIFVITPCLVPVPDGCQWI